MLELDLRIVLDESTETGLPVRGWYLPTTKLDEWIEVLDGCCSDCFLGKDYRLFIAPTSVSDIRASGLIFCASATEEHNIGNSPSALPKSHSSIEVPLGAVGLVGLRSTSGLHEIWMPKNSRPEPAIPLIQMAAQFEDCEARCYVWLPSVGLTAFEPMDAIAVTHLLRQPSLRGNTKNRKWIALPELEELPDHIVDIIFPEPMPEPFANLFEQEQDEIGGESNQLTRIDDQGNATGQGILDKAREFVNRKIEHWLRDRENRQQQAANTTGASGMPAKQSIGKNLSGKFLDQMSKVLQSQRDKQIDKLLKLMQTNPDKALRYAIPLASMSAFRGLGRSGNRLTARVPNFSLPQLFRSGPVDPWAFHEKVRNQLQAAYRAQAEREIAAGRFRRAAYIHAHLLGDLTAAAAILERAKSFREAAVIYGEKLKRPRDQARCLALAGQPHQAASIYEEMGDFEAAAKVWEDFADEDRSRRFYEKAVEQRIANYQVLAASKLLDEKLKDRPRAESLLWEQWPNGREVLGCAELGFSWLAEGGMHDLARERFESLAERSGIQHRLLLARLSSGLARQYPDRGLRETAEDRCRVVAGAGLREVSEAEMIERLSIIRSLQNDDALLSRDTSRFEDVEKSKGIKLQPLAPINRLKLNPLPALRLPDLGDYFLASMLDGDLFALLRDERVLYGVRAAVVGEGQLKKVYSPILRHELVQFLQISCIHFIWPNDRVREILLSFQGALTEKWDMRELQAPVRGREWRFSHNPLDVTTQFERCGGFGEDGTRWSVSHDASVLHGFSNSNMLTCELLSPVVRGLHPERFDPANCKMLLVGNCPVIALGSLLIKYAAGKCEVICDLGCHPNEMAASLPHTAPRIAIATDQSLKVVWLDRGDRVETICDDERYTHVCFVHGGKLLATTDKHLYLFNIYQGNSRTVARLDRQTLQLQKVAAVLSISAEIVGVLYQNGVIERYRLL